MAFYPDNKNYDSKPRVSTEAPRDIKKRQALANDNVLNVQILVWVCNHKVEDDPFKRLPQRLASQALQPSLSTTPPRLRPFSKCRTGAHKTTGQPWRSDGSGNCDWLNDLHICQKSVGGFESLEHDMHTQT